MGSKFESSRYTLNCGTSRLLAVRIIHAGFVTGPREKYTKTRSRVEIVTREHRRGYIIIDAGYVDRVPLPCDYRYNIVMYYTYHRMCHVTRDTKLRLLLNSITKRPYVSIINEITIHDTYIYILAMYVGISRENQTILLYRDNSYLSRGRFRESFSDPIRVLCLSPIPVQRRRVDIGRVRERIRRS
ncbi:unnamed protein product [Trichogramma brassicae]|uniref:Uncharacterized protein n=1 Tax=Trichogramma brassicae TaxID=86971 RepID=A0A6H5I4R2_9HYME|nr:unnamed protein product [Trichogramma brassicae]